MTLKTDKKSNPVEKDHIKDFIKTPYLVRSAMRQYQHMTDEEVIKRFQKGDLAAFDVIVGRYKEPLIHYVIQFVRERSDAEDIVQDTFVKVFKQKQSYRELARFSTWLYTVAGNFARSELRKRRKYRPHTMSSLNNDGREIEMAAPHSNSDELTDSSVKKALIRKAIKSLPPKYQDILRLRELDNLSYDDIARKTNLPLGTIKSRVNRGRGHLQKKLEFLLEQE
jgi:RNA polymerase sigma-70 factor, ECF subfamily